MKTAIGGGQNFHYNYRVPNMPYLFGNAEIRLQGDQLLLSDDHGEGFIAVSYTHLDVYKRQQLRRLCPATRRKVERGIAFCQISSPQSPREREKSQTARNEPKRETTEDASNIDRTA